MRRKEESMRCRTVFSSKTKGSSRPAVLQPIALSAGARTRTVQIALAVLGAMLFASAPALAQTGCNWMPWLSVPTIAGTVSMTGQGSGTDIYGNEVRYYVDVTALPSMSNLGLSWSGTLNGTVSLKRVVVYTGGGTDVLAGNGNATASDGSVAGAQLVIDPVGCTYTFYSDDDVQGTDTPPSGFPSAIPIAWGPVVTFDGSENTGFPIQTEPLPPTATTLSGQVVYSAYDLNTDNFGVAVGWTVKWSFEPYQTYSDPPPTNFSQTDPRWDGTTCGGTGSTVGQNGCGGTSMLMGMMAAGFTGAPGVSADPGSVANFLTNAHDIPGAQGQVFWDPAARDLSQGTLKFNPLAARRNSVDDFVGARQLLEGALSAAIPHPVLIGVDFVRNGITGDLIRDKGQPVPGHYVLVTGMAGNQYTVVDPLTGLSRDLTLTDQDQFVTRGVFQDPPGDISALDVAISQPGSVLVRDPIGNRSGADPVTDTLLEQIPGSYAIVDGLTNDVTGAPATSLLYQVGIFEPQQGLYSLAVNGEPPGGPFTLIVRGFNQDGGIQPGTTVQGTVATGAVATYQVGFASTTGATTTVTPGPAISSPGLVTFGEGTAESFVVAASGSPVPTIGESGPLPAGVTFVDNHNGTGRLAGTPAGGTAGTYPITFTATSGALAAVQPFTLSVTSASVTLHATKDSNGNVVLSWSGGGPSYTVRRGVDPRFSVQNATLLGAGTATTYGDPVLSDGKTYFYLVN
jgi:hypothetical protein